MTLGSFALWVPVVEGAQPGETILWAQRGDGGRLADWTIFRSTIEGAVVPFIDGPTFIGLIDDAEVRARLNAQPSDGLGALIDLQPHPNGHSLCLIDDLDYVADGDTTLWELRLDDKGMPASVHFIGTGPYRGCTYDDAGELATLTETGELTVGGRQVRPANGVTTRALVRAGGRLLAVQNDGEVTCTDAAGTIVGSAGDVDTVAPGPFDTAFYVTKGGVGGATTVDGFCGRNGPRLKLHNEDTMYDAAEREFEFTGYPVVSVGNHLAVRPDGIVLFQPGEGKRTAGPAFGLLPPPSPLFRLRPIYEPGNAADRLPALERFRRKVELSGIHTLDFRSTSVLATLPGGDPDAFAAADGWATFGPIPDYALVDAPPDAGTGDAGATDAGPDAAPGKGSGGCGCRMTGAGGGSGGVFWLLAAAVWGMARRRGVARVALLALGLAACNEDAASRDAPEADALADAARPVADAAPVPDALPLLDAVPPPADAAPPPADAAPPDAAPPPPDAAVDRCIPLPADAPLDLDTQPGVSENGRVITGRGLAVSAPLALCAGETDFFRLTADAGDTLFAFADTWHLNGPSVVEFVDPRGAVIGEAGLVGLEEVGGVSGTAAQLTNAPAGEVRFRVRSVDGSTAIPYSLVITRFPAPVCDSSDVNDAVPPGNDTWETATALAPFDPYGERYFADGSALCDGDHPDRDFYVFHAPAAGTRPCFVAKADAVGLPVALSVYLPDAAPHPCVADADCDGVCLAGLCRHVQRGGADSDRVQMVTLDRAATIAGDYYVAVDRIGDAPQGVDRPYRFTASLNPASPLCHPDPVDQDNGPGGLVGLGEGAAAFCETWTCEDLAAPRAFQFEVAPGSGDRTVVVTYDAPHDGRVDVSLRHGDPQGGAEVVEPAPGNGDPHGVCLNVHAGLDAAFAVAQLELRAVPTVVDAQDTQVDYAVRVVMTDLTANPAGRCAEFFAEPPPAAWDVYFP